MPKSMICICCPQGCHLAASQNPDNGKWIISGNHCPRGEKYAIQELTAPCRVVTAVVQTDCATHPCLPVRTSAPIPKSAIEKLLNSLYSMRVTLPVQRGAIIIKDFEGTGVNVISSETAPQNL